MAKPICRHLLFGYNDNGHNNRDCHDCNNNSINKINNINKPIFTSMAMILIKLFRTVQCLLCFEDAITVCGWSSFVCYSKRRM